MQTSNRLIYCKGGRPIKKGQFGAMIPQGIGMEGIEQMGSFNPTASMQEGMSGITKQAVLPNKPDGGGLLKNIMGGAGGIGKLIGGASNKLGAMIGGGPKQDPIAGGVEKGLDPAEMAEVQGAGKGAGVAGGIAGGLGDVAGLIPGPWGKAAQGVLKFTEGILGSKQATEQQKKVDFLAKLNTNRKTDNTQMEALSQLGQKGGVMYKRPGDQILSLVSGGVYKDGGKAPELKWNHKFIINLPETTMEKKLAPVRVFKRGGKFSDPDKTNVIVTGSRHHEKNALGDKGIPVIDKTGEKVFEVEKGELILTKEVTNKIEDLLAKYKKVEEDEDKAHNILKNLGTYFKEEISENLHNYEENVV